MSELTIQEVRDYCDYGALLLSANQLIKRHRRLLNHS